MAEAIKIHSRFATAFDTAKTLGVRRSRARKLITTVDDFIERRFKNKGGPISIGDGLKSKDGHLRKDGQLKRKKNAAKPSVQAGRGKAKAAK